MPLNWVVQVIPPLVVRRMVPRSPTAIPLSASTNDTPHRALGVPLDRTAQDAPKSAVRRIVPESPTATMIPRPAADTAASVLPSSLGFCQNQPGCAEEVAGNAMAQLASTLKVRSKRNRMLCSSL